MNHRASRLLLLAALGCTPAAHAQAIVADHTTTALGAIPDAALPPAAALRVLLRRASVGGNISDGLDTLQAQSAKYDRSRWLFEDRGNPGWQAKVDDFVTQVTTRTSSFDVFSMKFCFIDPDASFTYYRDHLLQLEAAYPAKQIVWWTIPIERDSGTASRQAFNDQVRAFARAGGKALFDIADIEAYDASGQHRLDASSLELMWPEWTSDGGHLSTAGAQRVASAWWWLMTRLAFQVGSISPVSGPVGGGTAVTVRGSGFLPGASLTIGGVAATSVVVAASDRLTAVTSAHATGVAHVTVTLPDARSATLANGFFFVPPPTATGFYTVPPCRLVDTRTSQAPALAGGERRGWTITGRCSVPSTAKAVALNLTVVAPLAAGHVVLVPGNGLADTSSINFPAGRTRANNVVVMLATDGSGSVAAVNGSTSATHVVLDVTGYFQ